MRAPVLHDMEDGLHMADSIVLLLLLPPNGCRLTMRAPVLQDLEEGLHTVRLTVAG